MLMPKRLFDILITLPLLIILLPLLTVVMVLVFLAMGSPIFYRQMRPGENGKLFAMFKFRTMTNACDKSGKLLSDAQRLTALGQFLRKTSLDELPELVNVLKGEMSLVGPRPLLPEYLERYTPYQARQHEVKPGITGWAQVNGRNSISWEEKFNLDVWYVEHRNLGLDLKILWLTAIKVMRREGIAQAGEATMQPFIGTPSNSDISETLP